MLFPFFANLKKTKVVLRVLMAMVKRCRQKTGGERKGKSSRSVNVGEKKKAEFRQRHAMRHTATWDQRCTPKARAVMLKEREKGGEKDGEDHRRVIITN